MARKILRKLDQATLDELHDPSGQNHIDTATGKPVPQDWLYLDKRQPYFRQGYVDTNAPRPTAITEAVMAGTQSFAIWDDEHGMLKTDIPDLKTAEKMLAGLRLTFTAEVAVPEEEPTEVPATEEPAKRGRAVATA